MLVYDVATTPDPTLPLDIPALPYPVTHRWIADSVLTDGNALPFPAHAGGIPLTYVDGGQPATGLVDTKRAITFDGVNDYGFALGANAGLANEFTGYAVVKVTSNPAATRAILYPRVVFGFNSSLKFMASSSSQAVLTNAFNLDQWYAVGFACKRNTGTGTAIYRVACSDGQTAEITNGNLSAASNPNWSVGGSASNATFPGAIRDAAYNVGTAHTLTQMQANIAALAAEYSIA